MYVEFVIVSTVFLKVLGQSVQICGVPALNYALVSIDEEIFRTKHAANVPRKLKLTIKFCQ